MTKEDKEILIAYAEHNMSVSDTARALVYHRNSVDYHLRKIAKETGLNPKNFFDLVVLVMEVSRARGIG